MSQKLFQAYVASCHACRKATDETAQREGGKAVAPIFAGTRVDGAEQIACPNKFLHAKSRLFSTVPLALSDAAQLCVNDVAISIADQHIKNEAV